MADPMRIRAQAAGDRTTVRVLMSHEMETGQRKDSAGKVIPDVGARSRYPTSAAQSKTDTSVPIRFLTVSGAKPAAARSDTTCCTRSRVMSDNDVMGCINRYNVRQRLA